jgi:hypothetical protein
LGPTVVEFLFAGVSTSIRSSAIFALWKKDTRFRITWHKLIFLPTGFFKLITIRILASIIMSGHGEKKRIPVFGAMTKNPRRVTPNSTGNKKRNSKRKLN